MTTSLNYYKDETKKVCKTKGWDRVNIDKVWLLLSEEFGELASAIRQHQRTFKKTGLKKDRGTDVTMELGDVFSYLFQLAHMLNIDLDEMWELHKNKMVTKRYDKKSNANTKESTTIELIFPKSGLNPSKRN
mgnify:CR=1 FL=1